MTIDELLKKFETLQAYDLCLFHHASTNEYHWIFDQEVDGAGIKISKRESSCLTALAAVWYEIDQLLKSNKNLKPLLIKL